MMIEPENDDGSKRAFCENDIPYLISTIRQCVLKLQIIDPPSLITLTMVARALTIQAEIETNEHNRH